KVLAKCGALNFFKVPRTQMAFEIDIVSQLTEKEREWISSRSFTSLIDALNAAKHKKRLKKSKDEDGPFGAANSENRAEKLRNFYETCVNPPYSLKDSPGNVALLEKQYLGI